MIYRWIGPQSAIAPQSAPHKVRRHGIQPRLPTSEPGSKSAFLLGLSCLNPRQQLYLDHIAERDLEGIVAKWAHGTYQVDGRSTSWLKTKNGDYSQMAGRRELFDARGRRGRKARVPALVLV